MSTKCTILYNNESKKEDYHFFYDYKDSKYHLTGTKKGKELFLERVGKLLESCPFSDSGIYCVTFNGNGKDDNRVEHEFKCPKLEEKMKRLTKQ